MAGGSGGSWKVAYADFVTAMMAFFLVMWLVSQDQKVKESIAKYFQNPTGVLLKGDSTDRPHSGGIFLSESNGPVPGQFHRVVGRSIGTFSDPRMEEDETLVIAEWFLEEPKFFEHWKKIADDVVSQAKNAPEVKEGQASTRETARPLLAIKMRDEMMESVNTIGDPILRDVMTTTMSKVDWLAIAEECLLNIPATRRP